MSTFRLPSRSRSPIRKAAKGSRRKGAAARQQRVEAAQNAATTCTTSELQVDMAIDRLLAEPTLPFTAPSGQHLNRCSKAKPCGYCLALFKKATAWFTSAGLQVRLTTLRRRWSDEAWRLLLVKAELAAAPWHGGAVDPAPVPVRRLRWPRAPLSGRCSPVVVVVED